MGIGLFLGECEARERFTVDDGGDVVVGGFDGFHVWFHDIE